MPPTFATRQLWALGIIAASCAAIFVGSISFVGELLKANWLVGHTLEVMKECDKSLLCMLNCETSYRGYLITADPVFLQPYEQCQSQILEHINALVRLTHDDRKQSRVLADLVKTANEKLAFSATAVKLRKQDPNSRSRDLVDVVYGKKVMDRFRAELQEVVDEEQRRYKQRVSAAAALQAELYAIMAAMAIVVSACILWITWSTSRFSKEQAKARELLAQARDAAVKANELKSQFVANISHEVRTPLSGILGMSELLVRDEKEPERKEMLEHINMSATNLLMIVNDLLDLSKLEAGRVLLNETNFRLATIVDHVVASIALSAKNKNIAVTCNIEPQDKEQLFCGDPGRLRQILLNLAFNAVKFTSEGSVTIKVSSQAGTANNTALVHFEVIDSGIGFTEETGKRLFQPFVQADGSTSRRFGGTGLGLSISKRLVELMAGTIGCSSPGEGKGAKFWFTVPLCIVEKTPNQTD